MKEILRKILLIICVCVFVYSAFQLVKIFLNYRNIEEKSEALVEQYVINSEGSDNPLKRKIDFAGLLKKNSDVIGWLYIPDTKIDEPILKGNNNDTYLRRDIDKASNSAGSIFIDEMNNKDFKDDNTIIYGHNMRNGSRFHDLRYYVESDFYKAHHLIYIYLPNNTVNVYDTYSASVIKADSHLYQKGINYKSYVKKAQSIGKQTSKVSDKQNPMILLSTCYDRGSVDRFVVFARLDKNVKIGE